MASSPTRTPAPRWTTSSRRCTRWRPVRATGSAHRASPPPAAEQGPPASLAPSGAASPPVLLERPAGFRSILLSVLSAIVSALHVLAVTLGLPSVYLRGRALRRPLDGDGLTRLFAADNVWGVAALLLLATGLLRAFAGLRSEEHTSELQS